MERERIRPPAVPAARGGLAGARVAPARVVANGALAAAVLQRQLVVGGGAVQDRREAYIKLEQTLTARRYTFPQRVWRIALRAMEGDKFTSAKLAAPDQAAADAIGKLPFGDWDALVDHLAEHDLVAAKLPAAQSRFRARKLARPDWSAGVQKLRTADKKGQAARHVLPSHLLGYAVERWNPKAAAVAEWVKTLPGGATAGLAAPRNSDVAWRQYAFDIVHNHPGNLWWGDSVNNSAIGFFAPHVETALHKVRTLDPGQVTNEQVLEIVGAVPKALDAEASKAKGLARRWDDIARAIEPILQGATKAIAAAPSAAAALDAGSDALDEVLEALEDVFAQLEFDPPDGQAMQPGAYNKLKAVAEQLTTGDPAKIPDVLTEFLKTSHPGTLAG
jgi:hypothetical protein